LKARNSAVINPARTSDGCTSLAPEPGVICAGALVVDATTPPFVLVWVDGLDVLGPGLEVGLGDGEAVDGGDGDGDGEGVGVLVAVIPTLNVGTGAVAVATTTLCVTGCGVTVVVAERLSACAGGWALQKLMKGWNSGSTKTCRELLVPPALATQSLQAPISVLNAEPEAQSAGDLPSLWAST
jgi:hypothetical protein